VLSMTVAVSQIQRSGRPVYVESCDALCSVHDRKGPSLWRGPCRCPHVGVRASAFARRRGSRETAKAQKLAPVAAESMAASQHAGLSSGSLQRARPHRSRPAMRSPGDLPVRREKKARSSANGKGQPVIGLSYFRYTITP
jgi:hypothetical protein